MDTRLVPTQAAHTGSPSWDAVLLMLASVLRALVPRCEPCTHLRGKLQIFHLVREMMLRRDDGLATSRATPCLTLLHNASTSPKRAVCLGIGLLGLVTAYKCGEWSGVELVPVV